ncbi:MAG TPA: hypothetical protein VFF51_02935 [Candidatus Methylomirabilis sp.]|nr:hypothetical protein [Candidatus Methylomirabilis sp.]
MRIDYGRGEHVKLMASRDGTIRHLVEQGYEFVTNAFRPGAQPRGVRVRDAQAVASRLRREGYQVEVAPAYSEAGDILTPMVSVWRKVSDAREGGNTG